MGKGGPTFVKWAGGKKQLLNQIEIYFPEKINTYVEPFLGGGAVLFYILKNKRPKKVFAYDNNEELINVYTSIRDKPRKVIKLLKEFQEKHNQGSDKKHYYYERRIEYNSKLRNKAKKAALFIYLNKTCFNGLYRVNSLGEFNVPFGKYNKVNIYNEDKILEASKLLKDTILRRADFREVRYPKNSFVYFDPPYWSEPENNGFTSYTKSDFGRREQIELAALFKKLSDQGLRLMLSNSKTEMIKTLYQQKNFEIGEVNSRWVINCEGKKRDVISELLIVNYGKELKMQTTLNNRMPHNIEAGCPRCNKKAKGLGGIEDVFGWRIMNGKKVPQSRCKKCRSARKK